MADKPWEDIDVRELFRAVPDGGLVEDAGESVVVDLGIVVTLGDVVSTLQQRGL